jgi:hypothetical protein
MVIGGLNIMRRIFSLFAIGLLLISEPAFAYTNSSNFLSLGVHSLNCAATTTSSVVQFTDAYSIGAPDVIIHNIGSNPIYYKVGIGGAALTAVIPTSSSYGDIELQPNDFVITNKQQSDTIACISTTGTSTVNVVPTYGN